MELLKVGMALIWIPSLCTASQLDSITDNSTAFSHQTPQSIQQKPEPEKVMNASPPVGTEAAAIVQAVAAIIVAPVSPGLVTKEANDGTPAVLQSPKRTLSSILANRPDIPRRNDSQKPDLLAKRNAFSPASVITAAVNVDMNHWCFRAFSATHIPSGCVMAAYWRKNSVEIAAHKLNVPRLDLARHTANAGPNRVPSSARNVPVNKSVPAKKVMSSRHHNAKRKPIGTANNRSACQSQSYDSKVS